MNNQFVLNEIKIINQTLARFGVNAGVPMRGSGTMVSPYSHISHRLRRWNAQTIGGVEKCVGELTEALSAARGEAAPVMLERAPLVLSVPYPNPRPMPWDAGLIHGLAPGSMLLGRSFSHAGDRVEVASFDRYPHILVCGATDSGKSTLMRAMMASLCASTSPDDLRVILIDLKNEDMMPFAGWPHVIQFAGTPDAARDAVLQVLAEKNSRIADPARKAFRLVLWIDELAQLADDSSLVTALGNIASIGRGKWINIVAATQHPVEKGGMGSLMKANFTLRLVGKTAGPLQSRIAAPDTGIEAHRLPGRGSFVRIHGSDVRRFQSFYITERDIAGIGGTLPAMVDGAGLADVDAPRGVELPAPVVDPVVGMAEQIRHLWEDGESHAAMIRAIFGENANTGGANRKRMLEAVEWLERATTATATTHENSASQAERSESSGSSSDGKIIRLHREVA